MKAMESELARVPGSAANGCAGNIAAFESPALRFREMKPPGGGPRLESGWGRKTLGFDFSIFRHVESEPVRWQAPPRKRTGAPERAGAQDLRALLLATTELVDGACLIRR